MWPVDSILLGSLILVGLVGIIQRARGPRAFPVWPVPALAGAGLLAALAALLLGGASLGTRSGLTWATVGPFVISFDRLTDSLALACAAPALALAAWHLLTSSESRAWEGAWTLAALLVLVQLLLTAELLLLALAWIVLAVCGAGLVATRKDGAPGAAGRLLIRQGGAGLAVLLAVLLAGRMAGAGYSRDALLPAGLAPVAAGLIGVALLLQLGVLPWPGWDGAAGAHPLVRTVLGPLPALYLGVRLTAPPLAPTWATTTAPILLAGGVLGLGAAAVLAWRTTSDGARWSVAAAAWGSLVALAFSGLEPGGQGAAAGIVAVGALAGMIDHPRLGGWRRLAPLTLAGLPPLAGFSAFWLLAAALQARHVGGLVLPVWVGLLTATAPLLVSYLRPTTAVGRGRWVVGLIPAVGLLLAGCAPGVLLAALRLAAPLPAAAAAGGLETGDLAAPLVWPAPVVGGLLLTGIMLALLRRRRPLPLVAPPGLPVETLLAPMLHFLHLPAPAPPAPPAPAGPSLLARLAAAVGTGTALLEGRYYLLATVLLIGLVLLLLAL